jgi:hypothetical protein
MPFPVFQQKKVVILASAVVVLLLIGFGILSKEHDAMNENTQSIESLQIQYQDELMRIDGVVAVSIGLCADGTRCLKIGASRPVDEVRAALPALLERPDVEVEHIGEIRSQ